MIPAVVFMRMIQTQGGWLMGPTFDSKAGCGRHSPLPEDAGVIAWKCVRYERKDIAGKEYRR